MLGLFWVPKIDFFLRVVLNFKLRVVLKGVWALFLRVLTLSTTLQVRSQYFWAEFGSGLEVKYYP